MTTLETSLFCHTCLQSTTVISRDALLSCPMCQSAVVEIIDSASQRREISQWYPHHRSVVVHHGVVGAQTPSLHDLLRREIALMQPLTPFVSFRDSAALHELMHRTLMEHHPNAERTPPEVIESLPSRSHGLSMSDVSEDAYQPCVVCHESMRDDAGDPWLLQLLQLPCGHWFHSACIRPWLEQCQSCPTCRKNVVGA